MQKKVFDVEKFASVARRAVAEGTVLIKNDNNVLPLKEGTKLALFGRSQFNYYKSGTGSGGMVNTKYVTGVREALCADERVVLDEGLKALYDEWIKDHPFDAGQGWASEPWFQAEMDITEDIAKKAAESSDVAVVLIGRTAGEDQDNSNTKGSYLLTDEEETMLKNVTAAFDKTVVLLNVGNIIDMKWVSKYNPSAVAYIWQGGQEGGSGAVDVILGDVNPSGRLTDTIAYDISDYPSDAYFGGKKKNVQVEDIYVGYRYFETFAKDKVLYPFGFGLSYTTFEIKTTAFDAGENKVSIKAAVKNTGSVKGSQVVQVYVEKPQGKLKKPARELVAFAKTKELEAGETQEITLEVSDYTISSYDDSGVTGHKSAYVLESGAYIFHVGADVRTTEAAGRKEVADTKVVCVLKEALAPVESFKRMRTGEKDGDTYTLEYEETPLATVKAADVRKANLPKEIAFTGDRGYKLADVFHGKCSMEDFIAQLTDEELTCIVRGEGMSSPKVTPGCGGAFGGVTDELLAHGIPVACCSDGPSGIRMDSGKTAFAMPNGTCLTCTWNMPLLEELYEWEGLELRKNKIDVLLGPGMNLHRHPLNGRNFEYFSEDPFLTGKSAAAQLRGMHKYNVTGTIKHFAMNTQETGRHSVEHVASERAIREIYLKGYEIAVKEGNAHAVMSTYGPINGYFTSSNYDLITRILREEWGFDGIVMTDWWARGGKADSGDRKDIASIVRAQNDLYMVVADSKTNSQGDNAMEALTSNATTRGEFQRCAANICKFIMNKPVFARYIGEGNEIDESLAAEADDEEVAFDNMIDCRIDERGSSDIDPSLIKTGRNASNMISVAFKERGKYLLSMTVRANVASDLAQIPLSIFKDKLLVKMVTLTGADREWQTIDVELEPSFSTFYLKLYFAQDGMEIKNINVSLKESMEEQIRAFMGNRDEEQ